MKTKFETASVKPLTWSLNLLISLGAVVVVAHPSFAQVSPNPTVDPFKDTQSSDGLSNLFNNRSDGSTSSGSILDLIQRITSGGTNSADFQAQQQQNLNDAAADFRAKQQQLIRQQQGTSPQIQSVPPVSSPTTPQ